jgi:hypothetical protein
MLQKEEIAFRVADVIQGLSSDFDEKMEWPRFWTSVGGR